MRIVKLGSLLGMASVALSVSVNVIAGPKDDSGKAGGGNESCPAGTEQVAKFETTNSGSYKVEGSANGVEISNANLSGGSWSSTTAIDYIIVKGGSLGANTVTVNGATSGTFSNQGLVNGGGQVPGISNIKFCAGDNPSPISITCENKICESPLPRKHIVVEQLPTTLDIFPLPVSIQCKVIDKNGNPVSGAVVTSTTGATLTTGSGGTADFDVSINWNPPLDLESIVKNNSHIRDISKTEVDKIREVTYALLPLETNYSVTATKASENATYNGSIRLTEGDVSVEPIVIDHTHHVKFSFYGDHCTITDGEDAPPVGLRVWQPLSIPGLTGTLPGDMFLPGIHYNVVNPAQAEYLLEKIDSAGNSTFEPVVPTLK
ncbi:MAG: hypothetical protein BWK79_15350 [Beggiatoa sp. IS2]|nr:MAG: hypothetical protein BWK79_15350 [Beggiatoa sp. IS2]